MGILRDNYYINIENKQEEKPNMELRAIKETLDVMAESKDRVDIKLKDYEAMKNEITTLKAEVKFFQSKRRLMNNKLYNALNFPIDILSLEIENAIFSKDVMLMQDSLIIKCNINKGV